MGPKDTPLLEVSHRNHPRVMRVLMGAAEMESTTLESGNPFAADLSPG